MDFDSFEEDESAKSPSSGHGFTRWPTSKVVSYGDYRADEEALGPSYFVNKKLYEYKGSLPKLPKMRMKRTAFFEQCEILN